MIILPLTGGIFRVKIMADMRECAGIAQSVEQLIRNQQVVCSSHITSSKRPGIGMIPGSSNTPLLADD